MIIVFMFDGSTLRGMIAIILWTKLVVLDHQYSLGDHLCKEYRACMKIIYIRLPFLGNFLWRTIIFKDMICQKNVMTVLQMR